MAKKIIYPILSILQIVGFIFIVLYFKSGSSDNLTLEMMAIGGIAGAVKPFLPSTSKFEAHLRIPAAIAGLGTFAIAIVEWLT